MDENDLTSLISFRKFSRVLNVFALLLLQVVNQAKGMASAYRFNAFSDSLNCAALIVH